MIDCIEPLGGQKSSKLSCVGYFFPIRRCWLWPRSRHGQPATSGIGKLRVKAIWPVLGRCRPGTENPVLRETARTTDAGSQDSAILGRRTHVSRNARLDTTQPRLNTQDHTTRWSHARASERRGLGAPPVQVRDLISEPATTPRSHLLLDSL